MHARIQIYWCRSSIFRHLKLELLTQFPASNDKKYINLVYIWRKFVSFYGYVHWRMTTEISVMYGSEKVNWHSYRVRSESDWSWRSVNHYTLNHAFVKLNRKLLRLLCERRIANFSRQKGRWAVNCRQVVSRHSQDILTYRIKSRVKIRQIVHHIRENVTEMFLKRRSTIARLKRRKTVFVLRQSHTFAIKLQLSRDYFATFWRLFGRTNVSI